MTINDLLGDFSQATDTDKSLTERRPVTIWLPADAKSRYDKLQEKSGRRFSKKAREVLLALIDCAEQKAG